MGEYLHLVEGVVVLDSEGKRLFSKYWSPNSLSTQAKQAAFEKNLFSKTSTKRPAPNAEKSEQPEKGSELKTLISLTRGTLEKEPSGGAGDAGDIILLENHSIVFRLEEDVYYYVLGGPEENEVVLYLVLTCFYDTLAQLLKHNMEKKNLLENFELMVLTADEMVDDGIVLETNPQSVYSLVAPHASADSDSPLSTLHSMAKIVKQNL